mmetsp:Transcript_24215/g.37303  ORF Transcript_24215/g.37303 Transcript_24215/m.37303 type:complete len:231 (+) Transcript_24215:665-1357(+)
MGKHFAAHATNSILRVVEVMGALQQAVQHHHVEASERETQRSALFFEPILVLLVLLEVSEGQAHEDEQQQPVCDGQVKLVLAEVAARVQHFKLNHHGHSAHALLVGLSHLGEVEQAAQVMGFDVVVEHKFFFRYFFVVEYELRILGIIFFICLVRVPHCVHPGDFFLLLSEEFDHCFGVGGVTSYVADVGCLQQNILLLLLSLSLPGEVLPDVLRIGLLLFRVVHKVVET